MATDGTVTTTSMSQWSYYRESVEFTFTDIKDGELRDIEALALEAEDATTGGE